MAITPASQAGDVSSILITRSNPPNIWGFLLWIRSVMHFGDEDYSVSEDTQNGRCSGALPRICFLLGLLWRLRDFRLLLGLRFILFFLRYVFFDLGIL